jgi:hypothetical protein
MFAAGKAASGAEPTDAQFNYVTMLLHGNGTNGAQNNTFVDSSTNNFTITRNGNTTQGTFTPYGSNWSNYFDGSSNLALSSAPVSATGTFTVECWVFVTGSATYQSVYSQYLGADAGRWMILWDNTASKFTFDIGASTSYASTNTYTANKWHHIAWVRDGSNNLSFYINGVRDSTNASVTTSLSTSNPTIANRGGGGTPYTGYISNLRITNTAVYSGTTYTIPTAPLTNISGTTLLTCQSNRFVDNETTAKTFTITGSPSVQRFSPFSPTTAYSTSVIGGSGYFDGSSDYLSVPSGSISLTGDFTVEGWVYPTSTSGSGTIILGLGNDYYSTSATFFVSTTGSIRVYTGQAHLLAGTAVVPFNAWSHVAFVRSSNTLKVYLNGVQVDTASWSASLSGTAFINLEQNGFPTVNLYPGSGGYISNSRVNTTAVYTTAFTPSTTPLTAITGTQLLLSYTNAGILDNAQMNNLETVGNAQISTSVKKYGTGSMYFDGTGDYLTIPSSPNLGFGSGDFTVEAWVYLTANIANAVGGYLTDFRNNSTLNFALGFIGNSGVTKMYDYVNDNGATSTIGTSTVTLNTWHHVAWVRSGTTVTMYFNGTANGTMTTSYSQGPTGVTIGARYTGSTEYITGYVDDLRITKGLARYTANFTAPTAAFPDKG